MAHRRMNDRSVAALRPMAARYAMPDPELRGHYVRVTPGGAKSFVAVASAPGGKQIWTTIGAADAMGIDAARAKARDVLARVRAGLPPVEARGETFGDVGYSGVSLDLSLGAFFGRVDLPGSCGRAGEQQQRQRERREA